MVVNHDMFVKGLTPNHYYVLLVVVYVVKYWHCGDSDNNIGQVITTYSVVVGGDGGWFAFYVNDRRGDDGGCGVEKWVKERYLGEVR